jgi:hypothetical protein
MINPNFFDFWDIVLSPGFLITFALAAAPFLMLLYSLWGTWQENGQRMAERRRSNR